MSDFFSTFSLIPCRRAFSHKEKDVLFHLKIKGWGFYALAKRFNAYPYEIRELLEDLNREYAAKRHAEGKHYYGGFHQSTARRESRRAVIEAAFLDY